MATTVKPKESKSKFATDYLLKNRFANAKAVSDAWKAAGKDGTISGTLVNKLRSSLGLAGNLRPRRKKGNGSTAGMRAAYTGKKRGRKPKHTTDSAVTFSTHSNGRKTGRAGDSLESENRATINLSAFEEIEADIDRLLFKVMRLGGMPALEDGLRKARRHLYGQISGRGR
jgi:hypothetical protein